MNELHIGARGWRHSHWLGEFYPEDLPQDWWLSYYSNEFDSVLVPTDYLAVATEDSVEKWVEDCSDQFMFFLEVAASATWPQLRPLLPVFANQLGGIVIKAAGNQHKSSHLLKLIKELNAYTQVCIEPSLTQQLATQERQDIGCSSMYWQLDSEDVATNESEFLIACFESDSVLQPMAMRKLLEKCGRATKQNLAPGLFFSGSQPKIENIRLAGVISQLLG